jgi:hypothetical protein
MATPQPLSRRGFLEDVGRGMLVAGIGLGAAVDLGLASAEAGEELTPLTFGAMEPLIAMMRETSPDRIIAESVAKLKAGVELKTLVAAAALANAKTFGGEDYIGFHTMMALAPAFYMSMEMPSGKAALPVLKVIRRNTGRIQESGGVRDTLHAVAPLASLPAGRSGGEALRAAARAKDMNLAERTFETVAKGSPEDAFNALLFAVQDNTEVHRVVLPYRAWDLLGLIGKEHATALLRQSVRYCVKSEKEWNHSEHADRPRIILPKMFDQFGLAGKSKGTKTVDDAWVDRMSRTIFESSADSAAEAAAAALADGISPDAVGEAIALAANQLVLRDAGRSEREVQPGKPKGSVHGDSIGVHACDSANAWRRMAMFTNDRNTFACLILGAYQVAEDRVNRGGDFLHWSPRPMHEDLDPITTTNPSQLLKDAETAIKANDQSKACAIVQKYGDAGHNERPLFDLMRTYAVSEDGALHAEKYYNTVSVEFATARKAFRWRQLVALARVTASEFGKKAPGYDEACELVSG